MSLRNKLTILSFTLMSLMTIPTLAENDASSVNSRIENAYYDVQIKTPEGWSETTDFNHAIPETFKLNGLTFRGLQFKNGTENHGCAVFFAENDDEDDDDDFSVLENTLDQAQELAFPGSKLSTVTFSKFSVDGSLGADLLSDTAKIELKGTIEANLSKETGDPSKITISGALRADSTKGSFAIGTGQIVADGAMPFNGTTAVHFGDDYQIIILMWGTDEAVQLRDAQRFLEAVTVTARTPVEPVAEPVIDIVVISEPIVVIVEEATPVASEPVVIEAVQAAPVVSETVAAVEEAAPVASEPVAVEAAQVAPVATEVVAATEEAVPATPVTPAA